jgi:hypothetical protein
MRVPRSPAAASCRSCGAINTLYTRSFSTDCSLNAVWNTSGPLCFESKLRFVLDTTEKNSLPALPSFRLQDVADRTALRTHTLQRPVTVEG